MPCEAFQGATGHTCRPREVLFSLAFAAGSIRGAGASHSCSSALLRQFLRFFSIRRNLVLAVRWMLRDGRFDACSLLGIAVMKDARTQIKVVTWSHLWVGQSGDVVPPVGGTTQMGLAKL